MDEWNLRDYETEGERIAKTRDARRNDETRGAILPFKKTEEGLEWALPQWMEDAYNAFTLPRDVLNGYNPTVQDAMEFAGTVGVGGGTASTILNPQADLGMFAGVRARHAPLGHLDNADIMEQNGRTRDEIWRSTGWFRNLDGNWTFEFPDDKMRFSKSATPIIGDILYPEGPDASSFMSGPLGEIVDHPELHKNYPPNTQGIVPNPADLNLEISDKPPDGKNYKGVFNLNKNHIGVYSPLDEEEILSTLSHEIQHSIDFKEGNTYGSNVESMQHIKETLERALPQEVHKLRYLQKRAKELQAEIDQREYNGPLGWGSVGGEERKSPLSMAQLKRELSTALKESSAVLAEIQPIIPEVKPIINLLQKSDFELYQANKGEVMARTTQARKDLNAYERSIKYPWDDYDVPEQETWSEESLNSALNKLKQAVKTKWKKNAIDPQTGMSEAQNIMGFGDENGN